MFPEVESGIGTGYLALVMLLLLLRMVMTIIMMPLLIMMMRKRRKWRSMLMVMAMMSLVGTVKKAMLLMMILTRPFLKKCCVGSLLTGSITLCSDTAPSTGPLLDAFGGHAMFLLSFVCSAASYGIIASSTGIPMLYVSK